MKIDLSSLQRLGIDEIAMHKGQGNYITVLVNLESGDLLGFAPSRKQEDIQIVLESWGLDVLEQIIEVSIDLSGNYKGLVQKLLPNAEIVADRFHVMKIVNQDLDASRKELRKSNNKDKNLEIDSALKKSKYALLKPEDNLTDIQRSKLEEVRSIIPELAEMHKQKEAFRAIFEESTSWNDGAFKLLDWMADSQENFKKSVSTLSRWFWEVTQYFHNRTTSGVVEGINNKLKLIKRSGYGFRNLDNFELRCLICWHLDFS